ncbi:MAG TPA: helix-turn-helix domain-containing protein [Gaiellaceae bacterium]|nr:helix-turn-helix domain-containing protein [Gaiellaceae bacterium]
MFEIGNSLREARLRQDLDFPQIEQATKIRGKYLRALEEEQFDVLPAPTYVKGFLRSYAEFLGLDGQLYVDEFNSRYVRGEVEDEQPLQARAGPSFRRRPASMEKNALLLAIGAIGALTALVFVAWRFGADEPPNVPLPENTVQTKQAKRPVVKPARVGLKAVNGNVWLQVRRGSSAGRLIEAGTLEQGGSRLYVAPRLWIAVRAPANLRLRLNGKTVVVPGRGSGPVRRLIVTARGVKLAPGAA